MSSPLRDRIGVNFLRPDSGGPGRRDFEENGPWLASQLKKINVKWTRLAFSWVLVQPSPDKFEWKAFDRVVDACVKQGLEIVATLGGHFDHPPVPAWAGKTLAQVLNQNQGAMEKFIRAWVERYQDRIRHWEILNEPVMFHADLTLEDYVERLLKPAYRLIKSLSPKALVLPCSYPHLPGKGDKKKFFKAARGFYDIHNLHLYADWGTLKNRASAEPDRLIQESFRGLLDKNGEKGRPFWATEIGWWGTSSPTGSISDYYKLDPGAAGPELEPGCPPIGFYARPEPLAFKKAYTGREFMEHPVTRREDAKRALWLKDLAKQAFKVKGCQKLFLWESMDEFEGGFEPDAVYGTGTPENPARGVDLWGLIAGDKQWRQSARVLKEMLA